MLAAAFFDGTIGIHTLQSTNDSTVSAAAARGDGADIFDVSGSGRQTQPNTLSLKQPPKWLRCPVSSSFGFGGQLITVSNLPSVQGKAQSSALHLRKVVTEADLVERAKKLVEAVQSDNLQGFAEAAASTAESWKALLSLFKANSREELVTLLGFSKEEVAARVTEAAENFKAHKSVSEQDVTFGKPHESAVSFAEPPSDRSDIDDDSAPLELTPSEVSAGITSDTASARQADGDSATTAPSLFGDDVPGAPQHDFYSTVGVAVDVPHAIYGLDSSVAATIGSGPSSVTSESLKNTGFKIYPLEESEADKLVTKAIVMGDFESAVALCLSSSRFADAILLAVRGGPDLLQRTQKAYFDRRVAQVPSLRLFQSIVTNDLGDVVQNADLHEWRDIFVVLCTFASEEEFPTLAEQLGSRLEYQFKVASEDGETPQTYRKNATLTYLAAARLERLVHIWAEEMGEEEKTLMADGKQNTYYSAHAHALQSFVEKVAVFRAATNYEDIALIQKATNDEPPQAYKLAALYDRYFEFAEILSSQGLVKEAVGFLDLTPAGYKGSTADSVLGPERKRFVRAAELSAVTPTAAALSPSKPAVPAPTSSKATYPGYTGFTQTTQHQPAFHAPYEPPSTVNDPYAPHHSTGTAPNYQNRHFAPQNSLTQPPHLRSQQATIPSIPPVPPPPRISNGTPSNVGVTILPPLKRDAGGWNDAPIVVPGRGPAAFNLNKPQAITSPFPNVVSPGHSPQGSPYMSQPSATLPPPPRPGSVNRGLVSGPPQRIRSPDMSPTANVLPPQVRPPSTGGRPMMAPLSRLPTVPQPTPNQYAPLPRVVGHGQTPSPGPALLNRPPSSQPPLSQPGGPYGPPTSAGVDGPPQYQQHQPSLASPYDLPPVQQQPTPMQGPPPQAGAHLPPGGPAHVAPRASSAAKPQPAAPKYRMPCHLPIVFSLTILYIFVAPGDRSHIAEYARPAYESLSGHLNRLKQTVPVCSALCVSLNMIG